jgi:hypothetical protein
MEKGWPSLSEGWKVSQQFFFIAAALRFHYLYALAGTTLSCVVLTMTISS